jgi:hypothetical protein
MATSVTLTREHRTLTLTLEPPIAR